MRCARARRETAKLHASSQPRAVDLATGWSGASIAARVKERPKELDEAIQGLKDAGRIVESKKKGRPGRKGDGLSPAAPWIRKETSSSWCRWYLRF
jgi:hypothetical protein